MGPLSTETLDCITTTNVSYCVQGKINANTKFHFISSLHMLSYHIHILLFHCVTEIFDERLHDEGYRKAKHDNLTRRVSGISLMAAI
jgi:hypothetical protein